jgi:ankyrin repeat protein
MQYSPLHIAARGNKLDTLKSLVAHQARIDQPDRTRAGLTPLMTAIEGGNKEAAKFLKENGADLHRTDNFKRSVLHFAARGGNVEILETLLSQPGTNVDALDGRARTPLHHACKKDRKDAVEALLNHGADAKAFDFEGMTPLHRAVEANYNPDVLDVFKAHLGDKADWNIPAKNGDTPLHVATRNAQNICIEKLLDLGADPSREGANGLLPLHVAVLGNNDWITGVLLKGMKDKGVPPDRHRDKNGWSILHYASTRDDRGHAEKLIEAGADVNAKATNGDTPLHVAVRTGKDQLVALLLSKNADLYAANAEGETPLDTAAKMKRDYIARTILEEMQKRPPEPKTAPLLGFKPPAP